METIISRDRLEMALYENVPDIAGKELWIWGAGHTSMLYQEGINRLEKDLFCISGYIDSNPSKIGSIFGGKPVIAPEALEGKENICVLICTIRSNVIEEIVKKLESLAKGKVEWHLIDEVILKLHSSDVMRCYDLWTDLESKNIYAALTLSRLTDNKIPIQIKSDQKAYFGLEPFQNIHSDEIFIDCGAYIGDTIQAYLNERKGIFKKIIAFEPERENFVQLEKNVFIEMQKWNLESNTVELYPFGVGEDGKEGKIARNGEGSVIAMGSSDEEEVCRTVSLDKFLPGPYSFLKADIESFEYRMLLGAKEGIRKYKPLLAICIYHNAVDFYSIPILIKSIVPEYKFAVRHHRNDQSETVLYAWI